MDTEAPSGVPRIGILVVVLLTAWRAGVIVVQWLVEAGVLDLDQVKDLLPVPVYPLDTAVGVISQGGLIVLFAVSLLTIWGLLTRRTWGWTLAIVTSGTVLALNLGWWFAGDPRYLSMLLNSVAVFYLNQRDLRAAFKVGG